MFEKHNIVIAGSGGIGRAVGLILAENKDFNTKLYLGDARSATAHEAVEWIQQGTTKDQLDIEAFAMPMEGSSELMSSILKEADIILDCLPGSQAPRLARLACEYDLHYANLTEYVKETQEVVNIAQDARKGFVLQTGLAPGFINILGHKLFQDFCQNHHVDKVNKLIMKVGALTQHARPPHYYGFTWSPIGVATEYVKDAIVVRNGVKRTLPALSEKDTFIIDGVTYESNLTSGGAADLPEALEGKVVDLDYKTIRYPGHYAWVQKTLANIPDGKDLIGKLENIMLEQIPSVEDDIVLVFAAVEGKDAHGRLRAMEKAYYIPPVKVGHHTLRAIQATTAAPLCEVARMLLSGQWQGPVFQSQLDTNAFLSGPFVKAVYGAWDQVREDQVLA
ncbi:MAG: saccharopine dehydrogenase C-terminal domain-containing protein [Bacteroidota bacterium]